MDGLLIIDKPAGPTSHDVVARVRRLLRERRIGHTGTLDPAATGVLALVLGKATRLAQFLSAIDAALDAFRGTFLQQPPAFSAKKVDGKRSHKLARARGRNFNGDRDNSVPTLTPRLPSPVPVTAHA